MITEEERQEIIDAAVEKALLKLPEVVGNLIMNQVALVKINREFYQKYPELASNKDVVASVVEMVEGKNLGMDYKVILEKAVPIIKDRLKVTKKLDTVLSKPNRDLSTRFDNGEL